MLADAGRFDQNEARDRRRGAHFALAERTRRLLILMRVVIQPSESPRVPAAPSAPPASARPARRSVARLLRGAGLGSLVLGAMACGDFDTTRAIPTRGSLGTEMYGVLCDRVGAQALREDLNGASFRGLCHKTGGTFTDKVDTTKLPGLVANGKDVNGKPVAADKQRASRAYAIARVESFARRRDDLIEAFDATFPDTVIPVKDLGNPDPKRSCGAPQKSGEGKLNDELARMLGQMADLYLDGTLPHSTQSLAKLINAFRDSEEAQVAWARLGARKGYRPNEVALGAARPMAGYPRLRDLANTALNVMSADSKPYEGTLASAPGLSRIRVPGSANTQFNKMLEVAQKELLHMTMDPLSPTLKATADAQVGRVVLSRPRDSMEIVETVMLASDPLFGGGPPRYIVRRDARGFAALAGAAGAPFVDANGDKLPDVDDLGQFVTSNGAVAPSPFYYPGGEITTPRDPFGRAVVGNSLLYAYVDTSHTFAAQMLTDLRPLMNPDASQNHESIMDAVAGAYVAMGARDGKPASKRDFPSGAVQYDRFQAETSPMLDLVYGLLIALGDKNADEVLQLTRSLFIDKNAELARTVGALLTAQETSKAPEFDSAKIPANSVFWDEVLDVAAKIAKEPGLLEDLMAAMANEKTSQLGASMANFAKYKDHITYNRDNINGPAFNATTRSATEMKTLVDRGQKLTGDNRSALQKFLQAVADTSGVAMCNKANATAHAKTFGISLDLPLIGTFKECEALKITDMAQFYLGSISGLPDKGKLHLRNKLMRDGVLSLGAATTETIELSSGISGFWSAPSAADLRPKPSWLNRLVHFDFTDTKNATTNAFIKDLNGVHIGSAICPERTVSDPCRGDSSCGPTADADVAPDGMVHGLRSCKEGDWFDQRDRDALFVLENFGFYDAIQPTVAAFVGNNREDLFVELSVIMSRHYANADASASECEVGPGKTCTRDNLISYEPLLSTVFAQDVLPAMVGLSKELTSMLVKRCTTTDPATKACTKTETVTGTQVLAAATRSLLSPELAKTSGLKDRRGAVTGLRNDGTKTPQVTPVYLITNALSAIDKTFADYDVAHPEEKGERLVRWRRARSQLVDQFVGVTGKGAGSKFANPSLSKLTPIVTELLRSQLYARCPTSFSPPYARCAWLQDELPKKMSDAVGGPSFAAAMDLTDALRKDEPARKELQLLLQYLIDEASKNDALQAMLASSTDVVQVMKDEQNLVPFLRVLSSAMAPSKKDAKGEVLETGLIDAQSALLAKMAGRALDADGVEICAREIDPNQVITVVLGKLVTPLPDGPQKGKTPLEVMIDAIAEVNRENPALAQEERLSNPDYRNISENVSDFLLNKERGLEQFYEVVRSGVR